MYVLDCVVFRYLCVFVLAVHAELGRVCVVLCCALLVLIYLSQALFLVLALPIKQISKKKKHKKTKRECKNELVETNI